MKSKFVKILFFANNSCMIQTSEKVNIGKLLINKEFNYKGHSALVRMSSEGLEISVRDLNEIRVTSDLDPIFSFYDEHKSFCNTLKQAHEFLYDTNLESIDF